MPETNTEKLRARLATESFLTQKHRELSSANSRISAHARVLSDELAVRRREVEIARSEAEALRDQHMAAMQDLRYAKTEMRIAERRLWASLETINDGFAVFGEDQRIIAANSAFFRPFSDLECVGIGSSYPELVILAIEEGLVDPGEMCRIDWIDFMLTRWSGDTITPVTLRFWNNRFVRLTERYTRDGDVVMLAHEITGQMRRQRVLEEAHHRAEAANRAKSAFLANISHEIRTPMNGVLAMTDILAEGELDEDQRVCLDTIRNSGQALLVIINDVLDYSKVEAGKIDLTEDVFDMEATIGDVVRLLQPSATEKGISLIVDYDMFLPAEYLGDKGRIRQVLMNLTGNAVKFTDSGHVLIRAVGLPEAGTARYRLHLTVEDTGIGIAKDKQEHVFGEFNQADSDTTRAFDGTGLGLSITKKLVELMGGEIWLESEPGVGSVFGFSLTLPLGGSEALPDRLPQLDGTRVILFDSDMTGRDVFRKRLMALGLKPETPPVRPTNADPRDLLLLTEDQGPGGALRVGYGPRAEGPEAKILHRPVRRSDLVRALAEIAETGPAVPSIRTETEPEAPADPPAPAEEAARSEPPKAESPPPLPGGAAPYAPVAEEPVAPPPAPRAADPHASHPEPEPDAIEASTGPDSTAPVPAPLDVEDPDGKAAEPQDPAAQESASDTVSPAGSRPGPPAPSLPPAGPATDLPDPEPAPAPAADPTQDDLAAAPDTSAEPGRPLRVLAAEDNATNQLVLKRLLKALDIDLVIASNGKEAFESYRDTRPDIVLTDISMPEMDGKDLAQAIRQHEAEAGLPPVPVVAMTAHADAESHRSFVEAGIDEVMTKPLKKDALADRIAAVEAEGVRPVRCDTAT